MNNTEETVAGTLETVNRLEIGVQSISKKLSDFSAQMQELQSLVEAMHKSLDVIQESKADKADVQELSRKVGELDSRVSEVKNSQKAPFNSILELFTWQSLRLALPT